MPPVRMTREAPMATTATQLDWEMIFWMFRRVRKSFPAILQTIVKQIRISTAPMYRAKEETSTFFFATVSFFMRLFSSQNA